MKKEDYKIAYENVMIANKMLEKENKQLKEQLENDIDRYEDTISYQLGFDKGKEYLQQRIDKAIELIDTEVDELETDSSYLKYQIQKIKRILGDK